VVVGLNSEFRFTIHDSLGTPTHIVTADIPREPVPEDAKKIAVDLLRQALVSRGAKAEHMAALNSIVQVADAYPKFTNVKFGPSGTILFQRPAVLSAARSASDVVEAGGFNLKGFGSETWDVFSQAGAYMGFVSLPPRFEPKTYLGSLLYGVYADDLGLHSVQVYRLEIG
jgi:hypothetical protein